MGTNLKLLGSLVLITACQPQDVQPSAKRSSVADPLIEKMCIPEDLSAYPEVLNSLKSNYSDSDLALFLSGPHTLTCDFGNVTIVPAGTPYDYTIAQAPSDPNAQTHTGGTWNHTFDVYKLSCFYADGTDYGAGLLSDFFDSYFVYATPYPDFYKTRGSDGFWPSLNATNQKHLGIDLMFSVESDVPDHMCDK